MRKCRLILSIIFFLSSMALKVQATHILGGEISYESVAPGTYVATYKSYYDPTAGIPAPPTLDFTLRSPGCSSTFTLAGTLQSNIPVEFGGDDPFGGICPIPGRGYLAIYSLTFTINPTQQQCQDWYLSVRECPRFPVANTLNNFNSCLYVEAYINAAVATSLVNSPVFIQPLTLYFTGDSPATFSNLALQNNPMSDSLVYSLKPAMDDYNVPLSYSATTSFSQPILSSSGVSIHPNTGIMTFTPTYMQSGVTGANRYTVVVEVAGYRKINGMPAKVSAVQRNLIIFISNNAPNANPELINVTANGQNIQPNAVIQVQAGSVLSLQLGTSDTNAGDILEISPPNSSFPGFNFSATSGSRPGGTLTWQAPATGHGTTYYFPIIVRDNACPLRGVTTHVYGIKVIANPLGLMQEENGAGNFSAYPNPFTNNLNFRINLLNKTESLVIYNLLGQKVDEISLKNIGTGEKNIQLQNAGKYAAGTYLAKLISEEQAVQTLKFVKH